MKIALIFLILGTLFPNPLPPNSSLIGAEFTTQGMTILRLSPDGDRSVIQQFSDTNLQAPDSKAAWRIWSYGHIALSDARSKIAYTAQGNQASRLFIYDIETGQRTDYPVFSSTLQPVWSPDESAILLHAPGLFIGHGEAIPLPDDYVFNLATEKLYRLTATPGFIEHEWHWTPDSKTLIFIGRDVDQHYQLFSISREGIDLKPVTVFTGGMSALCKLTFHQDRWYYVRGCNDMLDLPMDILYSTRIDGDNRLEVSLSSTFANVVWADIADIVSASGELYLLVKSIGDERGQFDQMLTLTDSRSILIYDETGFGYSRFTVEPQERYIALYNAQTINILDVHTRLIIYSERLPASNYVCNIQWQPGPQLTYNLGTGTECSIPGTSLEGIFTLTFGENNIISSAGSLTDNQTQLGYLQSNE